LPIPICDWLFGPNNWKTLIGNPALAFIREMQAAGQMVVALTSLALYKPAASSIRTVVETALYYTYFRNHLVELATLVRDKRYFVDKKEIVEYHKLHTEDFKLMQEQFGLLSRLEDCYSTLSAIVHGQLRGVWTSHSSLYNTKQISSVTNDVVQKFVSGEEIVHYLFLCTVARTFWDDFSTASKRELLKGLSNSTKAVLGLDNR
jgi:hypothetical protein